MKKCTSCNTEFNDDFKFCEKCGHELVEVQENLVSEHVPEENNIKGSTNLEKTKCPQCGYELEAGSKFCENCGKAFYSIETEISEVLNSKPAEKNTPPKVIKTVTKKQKVILANVLVLVCILIGGYFIGKSYYSKANQIERFVDVFVEKNPETLAKVLNSNDPNYKLTKENLVVFTEYMNNHNQYTANLASALKDGVYNNSDIYATESGSYFFLFKKYKFYIQPVYITMTTNQKDVELFVNGASVGKSDSSTFSKEIGPLTPGTYVCEGKIVEGTQEQVNKTQVDIIRFESQEFSETENINLTINKVKFDVYSNATFGDVYVDNEKVGSLSESELFGTTLIWHEGMIVQIKQAFEDGEVTSDSYTISEGEFLEEDYSKYYSSIPLDIDGSIGEYEVDEFLYSLYNNVSDYTDNYYVFGKPEENILATYFVGGKESIEYIDFTDNFIRPCRNSENKSYIGCYPDLETMKRVGINTYEVEYTITYTTYYKDKPSLTEKFRYKKATIKVENGEIKIDNLGGVDNFEIVQQ